MSTLTLRRPPPPVIPKADARRLARDWLTTTHPELFSPDCPVPLQVGIKRHLGRQRPAGITQAGLYRALAAWVDALPYHRAVAAGGPRYGLDGPAGAVTDPERAHALATLTDRGAAP